MVSDQQTGRNDGSAPSVDGGGGGPQEICDFCGQTDMYPLVHAFTSLKHMWMACLQCEMAYSKLKEWEHG